MLDYGEVVALFNFNAELPVELSFRKVNVTLEETDLKFIKSSHFKIISKWDKSVDDQHSIIF